MPVTPYGPSTIVTGPAATPSLHGLVASVGVTNETTERWEMGFTWDPETCAIVTVETNDCSAGFDFGPPSGGAACVSVIPPLLQVAIERTAATFQTWDYPGVPMRQLEAGTTKALEFEFWTGTQQPDNQKLASVSTVVLNSVSNPVTGMSLARGLAALEQAIANGPNGSRGVIHAPVDVVSLWMTNHSGAINQEGQKLVTVAKGNIVVAGAGYPGTSPTGAAPPANCRWVYATGAMQIRLSDKEVNPETFPEAFKRSNNTIAYWAQRYGVATFDPCVGPFAVLINLGA